MEGNRRALLREKAEREKERKPVLRVGRNRFGARRTFIAARDGVRFPVEGDALRIAAAALVDEFTRTRSFGRKLAGARTFRPPEQRVHSLAAPGLGEAVRAVAVLKSLDDLCHAAAVAQQLVLDLHARGRRGVSRSGKRGRETNEEPRSEEHTSELQSQSNLVCRL